MAPPTIVKVFARQIFDSRGNPTVEVSDIIFILFFSSIVPNSVPTSSHPVSVNKSHAGKMLTRCLLVCGEADLSTHLAKT